MSVIAKIIGIVSITFSCLTYAGTWTPIAGIPEPPFGVTEEPPALPSPWDQETAGFYYVCNSCPGAGSVARGTPSSPRSSFPQSVTAGDVVVMAGTNSGFNFSSSCSAAAPCFVIGDPANPPTANGEVSLNGSYYIVDGVHAHLPPGIYGGTLQVRGDHGAFRNGRVTGNLENGGASTGGSNIVILNNEITDNGDASASFDQDRNGVKVFGTNIWIIGNELARNSGDGVAVADFNTLGEVHHIYVGRNVSHDNKQTGFWVKEGEHVILSENISYNHSPSGSSGGDGMGGQYDSRNVWYLFNESYNNTIGIGFRSSNNGVGSGHYVIGNYIHDIDSSGYEPNNGYSPGSVTSWNSADISIVNNTLDGNTAGIILNGNTGSAYIYNNAITNLQNSSATEIFAVDPADVLFNDFNSVDGESTVNSGTAPIAAKDPYTIFENLYGMSIAMDIDGNARPFQQWDTGAYESQVPVGSEPKPPVLED